jgi:protein SCO1/2
MQISSQYTLGIKSIRQFVTLLGVLMFASACQKGPPWATKDISGLMPQLAFNLTEANRNISVKAQDYRGKILLVYFGYTHCPDVCPLTLSRMKTVLAKLGEQAQQVRVLFISVDPKRDKLAELKRYTEFFGPEVLGLRGDQAELRALTKKYRVTYGYDKPDAHGNYNVSHSSAIYVFDRAGEARLLVRPEDSIAAMTNDLKRLLAEGKK